MIAQTLLIAAGMYLLCGLAFGIPFVLVGVAKIDPHAAHGSWGFRLLIIPGTMFLWPLLARRWLGGHQPPEERNAHRCAAQYRGSRREEAHSFSFTSPRPSRLPLGAEREKKSSS